MTEEELIEIQTKVDAAWEMIRRLNLPRTDLDKREWIMSIPARPDWDPDIVIGEALSQVSKLLDEIDRLEAELELCCGY